MFEGSFLSVQNSELRIFFSFNTKGCHSHAFIVSDDCSPLCKSFLLPLIALKAFFLSLDSASLCNLGRQCLLTLCNKLENAMCKLERKNSVKTSEYFCIFEFYMCVYIYIYVKNKFDIWLVILFTKYFRS